MQAALDAGALAAALARDKSDGQRIKIGKDAFSANMAQGEASAVTVTPSFTIKNDTVVANANITLPTSLMAAVGINSMDIGVSSEVNIPSNKKAEIALVLDYSGSMKEVSGSDVKYVAMGKAATKLIDDLTKDNADKVRFALVPFSHHVYTSLPKNHVLGQTGTGTWTGCTQDRQAPYNLTDATPGITPDAPPGSKWGQAMAPDPEQAQRGCKGYIDHKLTLRPLSKDFAGLKSQLAEMTPYAFTHVALGVEFGYHVLSPNAPFDEGVSYGDKGTKKYMVVLTDGKQTAPGFGPGDTRTVDQGDSNLEALCSNAKASGITMITLAFDLDDSSQRKRLQACATDPAENFFIAETSAEMSQAFQSITNAIQSQVFLSK
jgi:hypothetical protein